MIYIISDLHLKWFIRITAMNSIHFIAQKIHCCLLQSTLLFRNPTYFESRSDTSLIWLRLFRLPMLIVSMYFHLCWLQQIESSKTFVFVHSLGLSKVFYLTFTPEKPVVCVCARAPSCAWAVCRILLGVHNPAVWYWVADVEWMIVRVLAYTCM